MKTILNLFFFMAFGSLCTAQAGRWQQHADYTMDVALNTSTHKITGKQKLVYTNNSPDTLYEVFYHLYFNAFQPGSAMDVRSRTIPDPDPRVGSRIALLKPGETGYQKILSLKQNGQPLQYEISETILEVKLAKPVMPGAKATFDMDFEAQVPIQIRRSGRASTEGIDYSMTQWYPKMCEYDYEGWHPNPYIAREFYGIWGDYDVKITIDSAYTIGGTGYLQNPGQIGKGYQEEGKAVKHNGNDKLTWHFKADNVHDFAWAADRDYIHEITDGPNGLKIHFFHQDDAQYNKAWKDLQPATVKLFEIMNRQFGEYPYKSYSIIQGGDGGMEYPMATLITGKRNTASLIGVTVHEVIHSWYQMLLATNESKYPWMDEGFTTFAGDYVMNELNNANEENPWSDSYAGYYALVKSGLQEPLSTHADHYKTNKAYGTASYSLGCVFLAQLGYIIGDDALYAGLRNYYYNWRFRHPNANDFLREMEKVSGMVLDWYMEYWINTTNTIDYSIRSVTTEKKASTITIDKTGAMPMPLDVVVTLKSGNTINYNIPIDLMRGEKPADKKYTETRLLDDWIWTYPTYQFSVPYPIEEIETVEIDPSERMADINRDNNTYPFSVTLTRINKKTDIKAPQH